MEPWVNFTIFLAYTGVLILSMIVSVAFLMFCTSYPMKWTTMHVLSIPGVSNMATVLSVMSPRDESREHSDY